MVGLPIFCTETEHAHHLFDGSPEWVLFWYKINEMNRKELRLVFVCVMYVYELEDGAFVTIG